jgi:hypothetical protein
MLLDRFGFLNGPITAIIIGLTFIVIFLFVKCTTRLSNVYAYYAFKYKFNPFLPVKIKVKKYSSVGCTVISSNRG